MDAIGKVLLAAGLMCMGASSYIILERLTVLPPVCHVTQEIWEASK